MKYGIATPNRFTEKSRRNGGRKIIWNTEWKIHSGIGDGPVLWDTRAEAEAFGEGQVWEYKILEFGEDGKMTKTLEEFPSVRPATE